MRIPVLPFRKPYCLERVSSPRASVSSSVQWRRTNILSALPVQGFGAQRSGMDTKALYHFRNNPTITETTHCPASNSSSRRRGISGSNRGQPSPEEGGGRRDGRRFQLDSGEAKDPRGSLTANCRPGMRRPGAGEGGDSRGPVRTRRALG